MREKKYAVYFGAGEPFEESRAEFSEENTARAFAELLPMLGIRLISWSEHSKFTSRNEQKRRRKFVNPKV